MRWIKKIFSTESKETEKSTGHFDDHVEKQNFLKAAGNANDGPNYTDSVEIIKQLKKDKKYNEAVDLLLNCIGQAEKESQLANTSTVLDWEYSFLSEGRKNVCGIAPWYYEQLAIIYRKQKDYAKEVAILERYEAQPKAPGVGPQKLAERLIKVRELLEKSHA